MYGQYEVIDVLGRGGMGVVYKARDIRLGRVAALKLLPAGTEADADSRRRLMREAQAASALNHPNIVAIYQVGTDNGADFIAMEYVPGHSLAELIARGALPVKTVLSYGIQITDALAAAHHAGIVHRDLKPANIIITPDNHVKVVDFGLAKAGRDETLVSGSVTQSMTSPETAEGVFIGTAAYMSPEQAQGPAVDTRSDVFSFGVVLYEITTGRRAFTGETTLSILAAVIHHEPKPVSEAGVIVPPDLDRIIRRCLRKDPNRRYQHIGDVKLALEELREEIDRTPDEPPPTQSRKLRLAIAGVLLTLVVVSGMWLFAHRSKNAPFPPVSLTSLPGYELRPAFSPDGNHVAFEWNGPRQDNFDIYVKLIGGGEPLRLTSDPSPEVSPAWSPDGRHIALVRVVDENRAAVVLVPSLGGIERRLSTIVNPVMWWPHLENRMLAWSPDSKWLLIPMAESANEPRRIAALSIESGELRQLTNASGSDTVGDRAPALSPDGRNLAFVRSFQGQSSEAFVLPLTVDMRAAGEARRISSSADLIGDPFWIDSDVLMQIGRDVPRGLWLFPAAGSRGSSRVASIENHARMAAYAPSQGHLAFVRFVDDLNLWRISVGNGETAGEPVIIPGSSLMDANPQISPDGKRILFQSDRSGAPEIWVSDIDGSHAAQVTNYGVHSGTPRWSPDGRRIAFDSNKTGVFQTYVVDVDGGIPRQLTTDAAQACFAPSWSRDGNWVYCCTNFPYNPVTWKSPASGGPLVQVSVPGGTAPFESPDGTKLYFIRDSAIWQVPSGGGTQTKLIENVRNRNYVVGRRGIYFERERLGDMPRVSLCFFDSASRKTSVVHRTAKPTQMGLTLSPDESWLIYTQIDQQGSDLMLVENFR